MVRDVYRVKAITEISVDSNGWNFLVIYGRHINGGFIAIPNHGICVEASSEGDTFFNEERLLAAGIGEQEAADIAAAIAAIVPEIEQKRATK